MTDLTSHTGENSGSLILNALIDGDGPVCLVCNGRRMYYDDHNGMWAVRGQGYAVYETLRLADTEDEDAALVVLIVGEDATPDAMKVNGILGELEDGTIALSCRDRLMYFKDGEWVVTAPGYTPHENECLISTPKADDALKVLLHGITSSE